MDINHLNEQVMGFACLDDEAVVSIGGQTVGGTGNDGQSHRGEDAVCVDANLMTSDVGRRPSPIVEQHLQRDVLAIQGPVEGDFLQLIAGRVKEFWIEVKGAVCGNLGTFAIQGNEREPPRPHVKRC